MKVIKKSIALGPGQVYSYQHDKNQFILTGGCNWQRYSSDIRVKTWEVNVSEPNEFIQEEKEDNWQGLIEISHEYEYTVSSGQRWQNRLKPAVVIEIISGVPYIDTPAWRAKRYIKGKFDEEIDLNILELIKNFTLFKPDKLKGLWRYKLNNLFFPSVSPAKRQVYYNKDDHHSYVITDVTPTSRDDELAGIPPHEYIVERLDNAAAKYNIDLKELKKDFIYLYTNPIDIVAEVMDNRKDPEIEEEPLTAVIDVDPTPEQHPELTDGGGDPDLAWLTPSALAEASNTILRIDPAREGSDYSYQVDPTTGEHSRINEEVVPAAAAAWAEAMAAVGETTAATKAETEKLIDKKISTKPVEEIKNSNILNKVL